MAVRYLVSGKEGDHLPVTDDSGKPSHQHMGAAWAALHGGYRGNKYEGGDKDAALAKLKALYNAEGMTLPSTGAEPDSSDVHVDGYVSGQPASKKRKRAAPPALAGAGGQLKPSVASFGTPPMPDDGASEPPGLNDDAEPYDIYPCSACDQGSFDLCECPSCQPDDDEGASDDGDDGDVPSYCMCQAALGMDPSIQAQMYPSSVRMAERDRGKLTSSKGADFKVFMEENRASRFADCPEWIPYLPKPGSYEHPSYGTLEITQDRIQDMVDKFNAGVYQHDAYGKPSVPIDAEHDLKGSGAFAWLHELKVNPDGSADGKVSWTDRGRQAMAGDRYRYFSPEWYDSWKDSNTGSDIANVVTGGALTTRPYFKTNAGGAALRPLVAHEGGVYFLDEAVRARTRTGKKKEDRVSTAVQLSEDQKRFAELERQVTEAREANEKLAAQTKTYEEQAKQFAEQVKVANERAAALEMENRRKTFAETAKNWVGDSVENFVTFMEGLDDTQRRIFGTWQDAHAAQLRESKLFKEVGAPGTYGGTDNPQVQIDAMTKARAKEDGVPYAAAARKVMSENPELMLRAKRFSEIGSSRKGGDVDD